jgi:uncharacterized membrane protein
MWNHILAYVVIIVVILVLDAIWLGGVAKGFYQRGLSRAIVFEVRWWFAACFYLLHAGGTLYFGARGGDALQMVLLRGGFFGLATYGTYNLTNLATVRNWPIGVAFADMAWGSFITMLAAAMAFLFVP